MPENLLGLMVLLLTILPGLLGERIYRSLVGVDWREKDWRTVLRLLGLSVSGVTMYALAAAPAHLPPPTHLFPSTYIAAASAPNALAWSVFLPYAGHLLGGTVAGAIAALGSRFLGRFSSKSVHPSAWDDFIRRSAPGHWVTVGLTNGEVYAGRVGFADVGVASAERDLILEEPALYSSETGEYTATSHQHLFISAANLASIATYYEPNKDSRTVPPGEFLFPTRKDEEDRTAAETTESGLGGERRLPPQPSDTAAVGPSPAAAANPQKVEGESANSADPQSNRSPTRLA